MSTSSEQPRRVGRLTRRLTVTICEAADMLGIGRTLAYEMARDGRLPTVALGARKHLVPIAALERLLAQGEQDGSSASSI